MRRKNIIDLTASSDEEFQSANWDASSAKPNLSNRVANASGKHIVDLTGDEPETSQSPPLNSIHSIPKGIRGAVQSPKRTGISRLTSPVLEETPSPASVTSYPPTIIKSERPTTSSVSVHTPKNATLMLGEPLNKLEHSDRSVIGEKNTSQRDSSKHDLDMTQESIQRSSSLAIPGSSMSTDSGEFKRHKKKALSIDDLEKLLQKCLRDRRDDHQYYVKSRSAYARHHHGILRKQITDLASKEVAYRSGPKVRQPRSFFQKVSPFAKLRAMNLDQRGNKVQAQEIGRLGQLNMTLPRQGLQNISVHCKIYKAGSLTVPPFTNYIPTRRNILIEDDKNQTFLPYHGDDAWVDNDYEELEVKILKNREIYQRSNAMTEQARAFVPYVDAFLSQMGCSVLLVLRYLLDESKPEIPMEVPEEYRDAWRDRHLHLDDDYYEPVKNPTPNNSKDWFRFRHPRKQWEALFQALEAPQNSREYAAAGLACVIFHKMVNFSLWEVIKRHKIVLGWTSQKMRSVEQPSSQEDQDPSNTFDPLATYADLGCLVCYAHECPGHGEFNCSDDEKAIRTRLNAKSGSPILPIEKLDEIHGRHNDAKPPKGLFDDLLGLNQSNTISGEPWAKFRSEEPCFKDIEVCSPSCFWRKANRSMKLSTWSDKEIQVFNTLAAAYVVNRRGPCLLALAIDKPCSEIFLKVLKYHELASPSELKFRNERRSTRPGASKNLDHWLEKSKTWEHHARPPFKPCNHIGRCDSSAGCYCIDESVSCEKTCMCADSCSKRYRGCNCAARGKVCWENDRCDCYRLNRECDPDLCLTCGANEVLDPVNRYRDDIEGKCSNVSIQRGRPRRTLLGHSKLLQDGGVDGWGLYMGENTKKGDYIGEYVGEVITKEESEARGTIYNKRNMSYLFDLNSTQTLDSTLIGNKFRYINHQAPPHSNCYAKTLFCNTVHRIGMFACKDIKTGEEMWFDYGEGFAAKFNLIKISDSRTKKRKAGLAQPKIPENAHQLSQRSRKVESPSKAAHFGQGVKENTFKAFPKVVVSSSQSANSPAHRSPHKKRKRYRDEVENLEDGSDDDVTFEPSSGILHGGSSDESSQQSDLEIPRSDESDDDDDWDKPSSRKGSGSRTRRKRGGPRKTDVDLGYRSHGKR